MSYYIIQLLNDPIICINNYINIIVSSSDHGHVTRVVNNECGENCNFINLANKKVVTTVAQKYHIQLLHIEYFIILLMERD